MYLSCEAFNVPFHTTYFQVVSKKLQWFFYF